MALVYADRVKETSTTTGTGTISLAGAATGFQTFVAGASTGSEVHYTIAHQTADEWEVGVGTVTDATPDTLSRTTIFSSSNSDSAVNFSAGTKDVFLTLPSSKVKGVTGGGTDQVFVENSDDVTADYTIPTNTNAMSVGPVTIASGKTVTISTGQRWVILQENNMSKLAVKGNTEMAEKLQAVKDKYLKGE